MELDEIRQLLELLRDTDVTELQIERNGTKVRIRREKFMSHFEPQKPMVSIKKQEEEEEHRLITVTSPIVGTFYRAASPEAQPFVDTGASVKKGHVLCIIEAMKLMNEIESEVDGIVVKILVENGQPVEYGEPLFLIEPLS